MLRACIVGLATLFSVSDGQAALWIVDQSGSGSADATTIQGAVDLASSGDQIVVREGVYAEQVTLDKSLTITGLLGAGVTTVTARRSSPVLLRWRNRSRWKCDTWTHVDRSQCGVRCVHRPGCVGD